jgi:hypothetical protein
VGHVEGGVIVGEVAVVVPEDAVGEVDGGLAAVEPDDLDSLGGRPVEGAVDKVGLGAGVSVVVADVAGAVGVEEPVGDGGAEVAIIAVEVNRPA